MMLINILIILMILIVIIISNKGLIRMNLIMITMIIPESVEVKVRREDVHTQPAFCNK